ncbi:MAG TPA: MXAN_5187 family protein [Anaeromyxobacteraceae bacterium]|nr:MXAN_5187 family protein [Anaeromyxobacteraceae bacterium]
MNRLKLWLYVLLLLGAGAGNLYFLTGWLTARSVAHVDRELRSAAAVADARVRMLGASAGAIADAAARAPAVVAAMADPAASPLGPGEDAVEGARSALKVESTRGALVAVAGPQGVSARVGGAGGKDVTPPEALLVEAQAGRRAQAWVKLDGTLWMVASVPSGRNGAVAVGLPLDEFFAQALHTSTGVDVTSALDGKVSASTAGDPDAAALASIAGNGSRRPVDVGRLGNIKAALDWPIPAMPLLFADPPAARALALPLEGAGPATLVLSQQTAPFFSGLAAYQVLALVAMALFLLVGILLGLFMSEDSAPSLPRALVNAADRIARGDFSVRAPALAGSAGTIASALNRAVEAAQHGAPHPAAGEPAASPSAAPHPAASGAGVPAAGAEAPAASSGVGDTAVTQALFPAATADAAPSSASDASAVEPATSLETAEAETTESSFAVRRDDAEPLPTASAAAEPPPEPPHEAPAGATLLASMPEADLEPTQPDDVDEAHWRSVYADFLRLRGEMGESAESLSYDRFRARLERNRDQLKDKHGARTVRFQPYLKDGKVALRATPVR